MSGSHFSVRGHLIKLVLITCLSALGATLACAAAPVVLQLETTNGSTIEYRTQSDVTKLTFSGHDVDLVNIRNLDQLPQLRRLEFFYVSHFHDWHFLREVKHLQQLFIETAAMDSPEVIADLPDLEYLFLEGVTFSTSSLVFDFKKLPRIGYVSITNARLPGGVPLRTVPEFRNVQSRPVLSLFGNHIEALSQADLRILDNFTMVLLAENPIARLQQKGYRSRARLIYSTEDFPRKYDLPP